MRVLVTGASGFVGTALVRRLASDGGVAIRASARSGPGLARPGVEWTTAPELSPDAEWGAVLNGVDVVVHLAASVHVMSGNRRVRDREFQRVNVEGTRRLAEQAVTAGVRRFVCLSSVKVHGERGCFNEDSAMVPADAYAISKRDAEQALRTAAQGSLEVVILRPPLVYGPGARAHFHTLLNAVRRGWPLPLGAIRNRRSLVGVDNLVDLIAVCMAHPGAASEAFLVSDGDDVSTPELVRRLALAIGRTPRLVAVPVWCLRAAAAVVGKSGAVDRLTESLQVDMTKARRLLGWVPPVTLDEGLRRAAHGW